MKGSSLVALGKVQMDHHAVLGLGPDASIEEVRAQFRRLAMVFHPDRNNDDAWCREQLMRLNASYEFLLDAARNIDHRTQAANRSLVERAEHLATSARQAGPVHASRREIAHYPVVPTPTVAQRIFLSALLCVALLGAVAVIGALIGEGQPINAPASTAIATSYYPPASVYGTAASTTDMDGRPRGGYSPPQAVIAPAEPVDYAQSNNAAIMGARP